MSYTDMAGASDETRVSARLTISRLELTRTPPSMYIIRYSVPLS